MSAQIGYLKPGETIIQAHYLDATVDAAGPPAQIHANLMNTETVAPGPYKAFPWVVQTDGKIVASPSIEFTVIPKGMVSSDDKVVAGTDVKLTFILEGVTIT